MFLFFFFSFLEFVVPHLVFEGTIRVLVLGFRLLLFILPSKGFGLHPLGPLALHSHLPPLSHSPSRDKVCPSLEV